VLPFRGESTGVVFEAILNRAPASAVRLNPDVPAELERIINKTLEKDRNLRYQGASEMRADLQRLKRDTDSRNSAALTESAPLLTKDGSPEILATWGPTSASFLSCIPGDRIYWLIPTSTVSSLPADSRPTVPGGFIPAIPSSYRCTYSVASSAASSSPA
jgi:serine/threonine protein kinase